LKYDKHNNDLTLGQIKSRLWVVTCLEPLFSTDLPLFQDAMHID